MMNRMIVGNLVHRPVRSLISIVAVALEVTLILLIVGLSLGMLQDSRTRNAGIGADVIVLPPGSSFIAGLTGAPMPIKIKDVLARLPHVKSVAPVVTQISSAGTLEIIAGIDLPSYEALSGGFHYLEGGTLQGLIGARDKATIFYLKLDDPANADAVVEEIKGVPGMDRYVVNSMASYL